MKTTNILLSLMLAFGISTVPALKINSQGYVLEKINPQNVDLGLDERIWQSKQDRLSLVQAIDRSLSYIKSEKASKDYRNYPIPGITQERVLQSLLRFRTLLLKSNNPQEFSTAINNEFVLYQSVGKDPQKTVIFTGYFQPVYQGSLSPSAIYRYPIYKKPKNFASWPVPHPTRVQLQGKDGLSDKNHLLSGSELVWLPSRMEAYLVEIQGSATIKLPNGKYMSVGFDGGTDYPYVSIGKLLVQDKVLQPNQVSLAKVVSYLNLHPDIENEYISRNNRFIFFRETRNGDPQGSIGVPITAERSIATDKSLMPPGALALIHTQIPQIEGGKIVTPQVSRYVLDQDTGSAIKGPARVDIFMGIGKVAGDKAGMIKYPGQLYYLLLKNQFNS